MVFHRSEALLLFDKEGFFANVLVPFLLMRMSLFPLDGISNSVDFSISGVCSLDTVGSLLDRNGCGDKNTN